MGLPPNRLKYLRQREGLTLGALDRATLIDRTSLSRYERGKVAIPMKHAVKLADYYEVSLDHLLGRDYPNDGEEAA